HGLRLPWLTRPGRPRGGPGGRAAAPRPADPLPSGFSPYRVGSPRTRRGGATTPPVRATIDLSSGNRFSGWSDVTRRPRRVRLAISAALAWSALLGGTSGAVAAVSGDGLRYGATTVLVPGV